ncbi:MAG TPA: hypothetical protein VES73_15340, partial [Lamprocystis sp. (in: g-proteobacteria)]|nr:hypothetical protein [Lamprocystis sp. (in: g-proteobacteria)]
MNPIVSSAILAVGLFVSVFLAQFLGRALGGRRLAIFGDAEKTGAGAVEGTVFALLGLMLAFTFSGAASRFDHRRELVVQQVNAIGTAWLRIDLLPPPDQPQVRELIRRYVDGLLEAAAGAGDTRRLAQASEVLSDLQGRIWRLSVDAAARDGRPQVASLMLPPLNEAFDLTTSRLAATRIHVQPAVLWFLFALAVLAGLLAGHSQAATKRPDWLHMSIFATLISATLYFIMDLEYPRRGLITLESADVFLVDLRASLEPTP